MSSAFTSEAILTAHRILVLSKHVETYWNLKSGMQMQFLLFYLLQWAAKSVFQGSMCD